MMLDGAEAESERRNDSSFQSVSTDAIAEFRVISNAFSAEYGRMANGVINFTDEIRHKRPARIAVRILPK